MGVAVVATALVGVSDNTKADPAGFRAYLDGTGEWSDELLRAEAGITRAGVNSVLHSPFPGLDGNATVDPNQLNLAHELVRLTSEKKDLGDELDAQRAQIVGLMMEIDLLKQGCVDATQEDGCPAGCVYDGYAPVKNECPVGYECATSVMHIVEKQEPQKPQPYQWHD